MKTKQPVNPPVDTSDYRTELGKIKTVFFGDNGDGAFGLHYSLGGPTWGTNGSRCAWSLRVKPSKGHWTEKDRNKNYLEVMRYIANLMEQANVSDLKDLVNVPIEATFDGNMLKSWRVLTEVL